MRIVNQEQRMRHRRVGSAFKSLPCQAPPIQGTVSPSRDLAGALAQLTLVIEAAHGLGAYGQVLLDGFHRTAQDIAVQDDVEAVAWVCDCAALIELGAE